MIIGGIVLTAVADELVLAHPVDAPSIVTLSLVYGASALYLLGNLVFKHSIGARWLPSHIVGIIVLIAIPLITYLADVPALAHTWATNTILAIVLIAEELGWLRVEAAVGPNVDVFLDDSSASPT